jgi:hypothetical protein
MLSNNRIKRARKSNVLFLNKLYNGASPIFGMPCTFFECGAMNAIKTKLNARQMYKEVAALVMLKILTQLGVFTFN